MANFNSSPITKGRLLKKKIDNVLNGAEKRVARHN